MHHYSPEIITSATIWARETAPAHAQNRKLTALTQVNDKRGDDCSNTSSHGATPHC